MSTEILHEKLKHSGLKVTPQRITIYETVLTKKPPHNRKNYRIHQEKQSEYTTDALINR